MATETIIKPYTESLTTLYIVVNNEAGDEFFDFDDDTFKALGSCTTPYLVMTEAGAAGAGRSIYAAELDLADINATGAVVTVTVTAFLKAGASPDPTADAAISVPATFAVQFGEKGVGELRCRFEAAMTSSAGSAVRLIGWLERDGQRVALAAGTCTWTFREQASGSDLFTITDSAPNAEGVFEAAQSSPGFTDDRLYEVTIDIVENGNTHTTTEAVPVFG